jgi:hypothetical protein
VNAAPKLAEGTHTLNGQGRPVDPNKSVANWRYLLQLSQVDLSPRYIQICATQATLNGLSFSHRPLGFYISAQNARQQISIFNNFLSTSPRGDIVKTRSRDKFTKLNRSLKSILPQHPPHHLKFRQEVIPKLPINNMGRPIKHPRFPRHQLVRCLSPVGSL